MVDVEQHMDLEDDIPHSPASRLRGGEGQSSCIREYEVFPGRNSICCSGRLITGPSQSVFIFNLCLIFGATTLFYVFIASRIHMSLVVIGSILQAITLYFLFLAAFTEPGIVKRGAPTAIEAKEPPVVTVGKDRVKLRWCKTCRIYRPPRCKHCRFCDNCVEEFDHHCPWVMNCVGKRNYRYFVAFVASVAVLAVFVFVCTLAFLIIGATKGGVTPVGTMVSIALLLLTGCLGCTLSSFAAFHCKLIAQGITTNEYIKGRVGSAEPRQQKGCVANCSEIYCQALPQSNIRLRGFVDEKGESGGSLQDSELGRVEADAKNETS